jgi:hypothetical protein
MYLFFTSYALIMLGSDAKKHAIDPAVAYFIHVVDRLSTNTSLLDHGNVNM